MNTYTLTKAMINSAVSRGIDQMEKDPKRSVRRLADLGKEFSKGGFHEQVFSVIQELLSNENSQYYDMMANLLKNSDHEAMRIFGMDVGYMSWTYGARLLRKRQEKSGVSMPWAVMLRYDPQKKDGLTLNDIDRLVEQGHALGINSYMIRENFDPNEDFGILYLFQKYPDCAFFWVRETGRMSAAHIEFLKDCKNVLTILPVGDMETMLTAHLMRDQQLIYAFYGLYRDEDDLKELFSGISFNKVLTSETAIYILIAQDDAQVNAENRCYNSRLSQEHPVLMSDYYGDCAALSRAAIGTPAVIEIGADKKIIRPFSKAGNDFSFEKDLMEELTKVMDPYPASGSEAPLPDAQ